MGQGGYSTFEVRVRAVEAVHRGLSLSEVAEAYDVDRSTLHRWVTRYASAGHNGLQRRGGSGRPRLFEELEEKDLRQIVLVPASDFGFETDLWTVGRLQWAIWELCEIWVSRHTLWRRCRDAGLTYQKPERQYFEVDEKARREWLRNEVPQIRRTVRNYRAILYFQDESNVSLRTHPSVVGDGETRRRVGNVGIEWSRSPPVPLVRQTDCLPGGHPFFGTDVEISQ
jgi:transposase